MNEVTNPCHHVEVHTMSKKYIDFEMYFATLVDKGDTLGVSAGPGTQLNHIDSPWCIQHLMTKETKEV